MTPGISTLQRSGPWWTEPSPAPERRRLTVLFRTSLVIGCGFGPLPSQIPSLRSGAALYWLRPATIPCLRGPTRSPVRRARTRHAVRRPPCTPASWPPACGSCSPFPRYLKKIRKKTFTPTNKAGCVTSVVSPTRPPRIPLSGPAARARLRSSRFFLGRLPYRVLPPFIVPFASHLRTVGVLELTIIVTGGRGPLRRSNPHFGNVVGTMESNSPLCSAHALQATVQPSRRHRLRPSRLSVIRPRR